LDCHIVSRVKAVNHSTVERVYLTQVP